MNSKAMRSAITIAVGAAIWFGPIPADFMAQAWHLLAVFFVTIIGYILTPIPIGVVAFTSISLSVL